MSTSDSSTPGDPVDPQDYQPPSTIDHVAPAIEDSLTIRGVEDLYDLATDDPPVPMRRRRIRLPIILFVLTCVSTFVAGAMKFDPLIFFSRLMDQGFMQQVFNGQKVLLSSAAVQEGLIYMAAVLGILFLHEMGHYLQTVRYKIPASLPMFIPIPIHPLGTMGAVIGMDGLRADRKQLFDIGISGPLAGLVLAIPIVCYGITLLDPKIAQLPGDMVFTHPLFVQYLLPTLNPEFAEAFPNGVSLQQLNPLYMAGWVGLLITGLNMVPMSQLDGGHVVYTLFGKFGNKIARFTLIAAIAYIVITGKPIWLVMLILVIFIGVDHPPTANDEVRLGPVRDCIGIVSLAIPFFCFPLDGIIEVPRHLN